MMMGATQQSIGAELRAVRMARGETTADVAHQLRLREGYIEAIESGNFEVLPGVTYAIGFLRSYARYLRLDADDLIQRFKEEVSDITPPADLAFLEPVSESRVPRGGLVVLAVLLAVAAYGGWYYLSTRDLTVADLVPAVPEQFSNVMTAPDRPETSQPSELGDLAPPGPDNDATESAATDSTVDGAPAPPERLGSGGAVVGVPPAPGGAEATPGTSPGIPAVPPVAGAGAGDSAVRADGSGSAEGPRVYGEGNAGSRITLRAGGESWIQVRASDDTLLMTRTLRAGDSYRVPNQSGLKLMTGNAGALEVLVDGETAPAIGAMGAVKRNVMLEPDRLKAGTAAN
jgi:cytoskeleton protein RodZ